MGGSVAVHVAAKKMIPSIHGLIVVDVVEVSFSLTCMSTCVRTQTHASLFAKISVDFETGNCNGIIGSHAKDPI